MATITMTEFNRNPSRAARLARVEPLTVTDHGEPSLEVRSLAKKQLSNYERLLSEGRITPAKNRTRMPINWPKVDPQVAREIMDQFWTDRESNEYQELVH